MNALKTENETFQDKLRLLKGDIDNVNFTTVEALLEQANTNFNDMKQECERYDVAANTQSVEIETLQLAISKLTDEARAEQDELAKLDQLLQEESGIAVLYEKQMQYIQAAMVQAGSPKQKRAT